MAKTAITKEAAPKKAAPRKTAARKKAAIVEAATVPVVHMRAESATPETLIQEQDIRARATDEQPTPKHLRQDKKAKVVHAFGSCVPMGECPGHE